jgi:hypothetical protein
MLGGAERKRRLALDAAGGRLVTWRPADVQRAYAEHGFADEWRLHHQGGLTGYKGREVFGVPDEPTSIPRWAAVAWNPSLTGGAKSEDTALVSGDGVEIVTRKPQLPELEVGGFVRPGITLV